MKRVSTAALVFAVAFLASSPAWAQTITLKLHHFVPPVAPPHATFLAPWAAKVEKESGGRLKIQIFPSMQLGGTPPQLIGSTWNDTNAMSRQIEPNTPGKIVPG